MNPLKSKAGIKTKLFLMLLVAYICRSLTSVISKIASSYNHMSYIFLSYLLSSIGLFIFSKFSSRKIHFEKNGILLGIFNFLGFLFLLKAFEFGNLSLVQPIGRMSFLVTIILSGIVFKEKFTKRIILGIILALLAIFLIWL